MADLSRVEQHKLERLLQMEGGYVLDFTNLTFEQFIKEKINIDIYSDKYEDNGDSKAKRLRAFWAKEDNYTVGILLTALLTRWRENVEMRLSSPITSEKQKLYDECEKVASRLLGPTTVENIEAIKEDLEDKDFNLLAKSIKESITKNQPETALDRLHTYVVKYIRGLCKKHGIEIKKEESLNAIFGKYIKFIIPLGKIEGTMSERILKYSINILEAFNDIRNNKSFAHDNPILNYQESILIFNNITSSIKFIQYIEDQIDKEKKKEESGINWNWDIDDTLPF